MNNERQNEPAAQEHGCEENRLGSDEVVVASPSARRPTYASMERATYYRVVVFLCLLLIPYSVATYNHEGEDCFITYRYVEHFVAGHGLVFNVGERVEGYSNFLWLLILAFFRWLGVGVPNIAKLLGVLSNCATVFVAAFFFVRKGDRSVDWLNLTAPLLIFFNPFLHLHSDQGLETCFYAFEMLLVALFFYRRKFILCSLSLSALALTRPEGFAYFFVLAPLLLLELRSAKEQRRSFAVSLLQYAVPFAIILGAFFIWRRMYFGQWLPNTVYAKVSKANFYQNPSFKILWDFVMSCSFVPVVALLAFVGIRHVDAERRRARAILLLLMGGIVAYSLLIGNIFYTGFRHQAPMIPLYALLAQEFLGDVRASLGRSWRWIFGAIWMALAALNFYTVSNGDAPRTRLHIRTYEFLTRWDVSERLVWYLEESVLLRADAGKWIDYTLPEDALIAADQIGQLAYYACRPTIDLLGLTDRHIARNGYSLDYLLQRDPTHVVLFANRKGVPHIPFLAETVCDSRFEGCYKLVTIIRANHLYDMNEFLVYARRQGNERAHLKTIYIGLNGVEWNRRWRVDQAGEM